MIYQALADTTHWVRWYASPEDVYLWRAKMTGAQIASVEDALLLLRAAAKAQTLKLDTQAVLIEDPTAKQTNVDVVYVADSTIPYLVPDTPKVVADRIARDPELRHRFANIQFSDPDFRQLTAPSDSIDFWRQHSTVYNDKVGPTSAWVAKAGVYVGTADDGPRAKRWQPEPEPNLNGNGKNGKPPEGSSTFNFIAWVAAGAAASWLLAHVISRETRT